MQFTLPDKSVSKIPVNQAEIKEVNGKNYYVFTCEVVAKDMASKVKAQLVLSDGSKCTEYIYSVRDYAEYFIESETASTYNDYYYRCNLIKSMLTYGTYSQKYFNYNTDNLANTKYYYSIPEITANTVNSYKFTTDGTAEGFEYVGSSLSLKSETAIKHYFKLDNGVDVNTLDFKIDGTSVTPVKSGEYYYIKISNIAAQDIDKFYTVTVNDFTLKYSALSYVYAALSLTEEGNENLHNLCKSLYSYNSEADDYLYYITNNS